MILMFKLDTLQSRSLLISIPFTSPNQTKNKKKQMREKLEKVFCVLHFFLAMLLLFFISGRFFFWVCVVRLPNDFQAGQLSILTML